MIIEVKHYVAEYKFALSHFIKHNNVFLQIVPEKHYSTH